MSLVNCSNAQTIIESAMNIKHVFTSFLFFTSKTLKEKQNANETIVVTHSRKTTNSHNLGDLFHWKFYVYVLDIFTTLYLYYNSLNIVCINWVVFLNILFLFVYIYDRLR